MAAKKIRVGDKGWIICPSCKSEVEADLTGPPTWGIMFALPCGCKVSGPDLEGRGDWPWDEVEDEDERRAA